MQNTAVWLASVSALVVVAAGALKLVRPMAIVAALRSLGWPAARRHGLAIGATEVVVGTLAVAWPTPPTLALLAVASAGITMVSLRSVRRGLTSCGCFGKAAVRPTAFQVGANVVGTASAAVASAALVSGDLGSRGLGWWGSVAVGAAVLFAAEVLIGLRARRQTLDGRAAMVDDGRDRFDAQTLSGEAVIIELRPDDRDPRAVITALFLCPPDAACDRCAPFWDDLAGDASSLRTRGEAVVVLAAVPEPGQIDASRYPFVVVAPEARARYGAWRHPHAVIATSQPADTWWSGSPASVAALGLVVEDVRPPGTGPDAVEAPGDDEPVRPASGVVSVELPDATLLVATQRRSVHRLNAEARSVWKLLEHGETIRGAADLLGESFSVDPEVMLADVRHATATFAGLGLIGGPTGAPAAGRGTDELVLPDCCGRSDLVRIQGFPRMVVDLDGRRVAVHANDPDVADRLRGVLRGHLVDDDVPSGNFGVERVDLGPGTPAAASLWEGSRRITFGPLDLVLGVLVGRLARRLAVPSDAVAVDDVVAWSRGRDAVLVVPGGGSVLDPLDAAWVEAGFVPLPGRVLLAPDPEGVAVEARDDLGPSGWIAPGSFRLRAAILPAGAAPVLATTAPLEVLVRALAPHLAVAAEGGVAGQVVRGLDAVTVVAGGPGPAPVDDLASIDPAPAGAATTPWAL